MVATNVRAYRSEPRFNAILTRIGCGINERTRLTTDGFTTMESVVRAYTYKTDSFKSHLHSLNKAFAGHPNNPIYFTPVVIRRLLGILFHFDQAANTFHSLPDLNGIDADTADTLSESYADAILDESDDDDASEVKLPKLEGSSNWRLFKDKLKLKLSATKGVRNIPLDYIIDGTDRPIINARTPYTDDDDINVYDTDFIRSRSTHWGPHYKKDNKRVLLVLKKHLLNTPSYNHIISAVDRLDGRLAYQTLVAYYEGEDFRERNISSAFETLNSIFYRGDTPRFTFEKYVSIHMEAHRLLYEAEYNNGVGMDDATKIQHLKNGIKADTGLEHAFTTARTNRMAQGDFNSFVTFLAAEVDSKNKRRHQLKTRERQVKSVASDNTNKGGRGRGRNRQSSNTLLGPMLSAVVDGKRVEGKIYPQAEFSALTKRQRGKVIELYRRRKEAGKNSNTSAIGSLSDTISAAVVAGVRAATNTNLDDESLTIDLPNTQPTDAGSTSNTSRRAASSGGVGEYMAKRRKGNSPSASNSL